MHQHPHVLVPQTSSYTATGRTTTGPHLSPHLTQDPLLSTFRGSSRQLLKRHELVKHSISKSSFLTGLTWSHTPVREIGQFSLPFFQKLSVQTEAQSLMTSPWSSVKEEGTGLSCRMKSSYYTISTRFPVKFILPVPSSFLYGPSSSSSHRLEI